MRAILKSTVYLIDPLRVLIGDLKLAYLKLNFNFLLLIFFFPQVRAPPSYLYFPRQAYTFGFTLPPLFPSYLISSMLTDLIGAKFKRYPKCV